jgi:predicted O-linked N-acetylglucosamine transferase (SPINDLY family)
MPSCLSVGYVSAHFRRHAVAVFLEPVLAAHDHSAVRVFCYSDVRCPDEVTARFKAHADVWRDVAGLSDEQLAEQVRADRLDILVDLAGHIAGNRMLLFARKPAPIQVTYLGYQATTGLATMDYRLTDAVADPPGQTEAFHTEKLFRLPRAFFCYRPPMEMPPVSELPARSAGHVTFASMNNFAKVSPRCLALWARLLKAVPGSRLALLIAGGAPNAGRILPAFTQAGVDGSRIEFVGRLGLQQYLEMYRRIDILLDPMPFSGHTTTCDALWMGVPVVTLAGPAYVSRMTASVLAHLPLPELIAQSAEQYLAIAAGLATDLDRLADLRRRLRGMMQQSCISDAAGFARDLEAAYQRMCAAGPPHS